MSSIKNNKLNMKYNKKKIKPAIERCLKSSNVYIEDLELLLKVYLHYKGLENNKTYTITDMDKILMTARSGMGRFDTTGLVYYVCDKEGFKIDKLLDSEMKVIKAYIR